MQTGLGTEQASSRAPLVKWVRLWVPVGLGRSSLGWEEVSGFLYFLEEGGQGMMGSEGDKQ